MGNREKPFNVIDAVLLLGIAIVVDASSIIAFLLFAIPVLGEVSFVMAEAAKAFLSLVILGIFIYKTRSFGGGALVETGGMAASLVGIPGQTVAVIAGMLIANHPRAAALAEGKIAGATAGGATDGEPPS